MKTGFLILFVYLRVQAKKGQPYTSKHHDGIEESSSSVNLAAQHKTNSTK